MVATAETTAAPAENGSAAEQTALGKRLLTGDGVPLEPQRGAALIASAAANGDAEAAALAAVLIALGAQSAADWTKALEYLQQAAESGWHPAQRQLIVLSGEAELEERAQFSAPPETWGRLRRSIDISAWLTVPPPREISGTPRIALHESFLAPRICKWLIARATPGLSRSQVFAPSGMASVADARTNSAFEFGLLSLDLVLLLTRARIAAAAGFAPHALEHTNVLHYAAGQRFSRHYDFLDPALPGLQQEIAARGQRVGSFLVYLNDDYSGAETEFSLLDRRFRCPTGGALSFRNVEPSGAPDRATLHAGLPPASGEKWLLSQWIRDRSG